MIFVHFLDAYKGKSRFGLLEFVKRVLIVRMREVTRDSTKREMATAQSENHITRVITILISRGMIGRDVNARPARMPVYLAGREKVCGKGGGGKVGDGTESKLPVAAKPPR
ncbi:hypothetical protein ALC56_09604 [Trachymyrmex septentrionalis]|uniref:Uncharacterized protein n=1 Tax=Trachymyrmex septentrionalis TaxID=34720 RepID=A0A195F7A7_9HYME|nr:hypothetical protein ALC56_09604 [Trachymyrmex septentrionalis]